MPGKKQTSREQELAITEMALRERLNASQIFRALDDQGLLKDPHPVISLRTVQSRVRELTITDTSGPWSFADADPEEARLVLDVVEHVFSSTTGREWPSRDRVAEIVRLRKAVPDIPDLWADRLAQAYILFREHKRDSRHLDLALALRPWAGVWGADQLARALGLPRSFCVRQVDNRGGYDSPLIYADSISMLMEVVAFEGSVDEIRTRLESVPRYHIYPPPEITVVDGLGEPVAPAGS